MYRPPEVRPKSNFWEVGLFMSKYTFEFKKKIVQSYLNGEGGYGYLAKVNDIPSSTRVEEWVKAYTVFGDDGLKRSRKQRKYSFEFKLHVVELYLTSEVSYQQLALQEGIVNPSQLVRWVNDFQIAGPDALRPKKKGRKKAMNSSSKNKTYVEHVSVDTSAEHVKQLEDELLKLRIENAFLKELRRLRLEDEAKARKLLESSTASEESSN